MAADVVGSAALAISLSFPRGVYSGGTLGLSEDLPAHARVYEAFVAAAAGGPAARPEGNVLVAIDKHRRAVEWLEETEPLGLIAPDTQVSTQSARRYRWRASPVAPTDSPFEPFSALSAPVLYLWPFAPDDVFATLRELAREVTHVGRADSMVIASVQRMEVTETRGLHLAATGRGEGRVMRVARPGRFAALATAHATASRPSRHGTGSMGKQAADELATANDEALELRRFAPTASKIDWPFAEIWQLTVDSGDKPAVLEALLDPQHRVAAAVGIHKALVSRIGDNVPAFITGRDGDGPLQGSGHLAIHLAPSLDGGSLAACLAIPRDTVDADREQLAHALRSPLRAGAVVRRGDTRWFSVAAPTLRSAPAFWPAPSTLLQTAVPLVVEINGGPRRGAWTLDDAVVCSIGFAMRRVLERPDAPWGSGWAFRAELVRRLREEHGVDARTSRVRRNALLYAHRVRDHDLVVATHALVTLGNLAPPDGAGFLALGRARHLGGGLLVPNGALA